MILSSLSEVKLDQENLKNRNRHSSLIIDFPKTFSLKINVESEQEIERKLKQYPEGLHLLILCLILQKKEQITHLTQLEGKKINIFSTDPI